MWPSRRRIAVRSAAGLDPAGPARRSRRLLAAALCLAGATAAGQGVAPSPQGPVVAKQPALRVTGRHFTDPAGRVVILRGVNLSGCAKVPPFLNVNDVSDLDRLPHLGFNVIRLVFIWEAFEPSPGVYDDVYLARARGVADAAWARGLYVIVDVHQDGFSRCLARGSGDGFPLWAVSRRASATTPDNGPGLKDWPVLMATDPNMHRSFADFYADAAGVRTRYLLMLGRVAAAFATSPGVIGYDPLNEPWGSEREAIAPLYRDAAVALRASDPTAILFLEGHVTTNCGLQSRLPRPAFANAAYAPHYYFPPTIVRNAWGGRTLLIDRGFAHMRAKAEEWDAPLFLGEFGVPASSAGAGEYVNYLYDHLDDALASGAQWNYTPGWNDRNKDGWNGEDFNILLPDGRLRPNFCARPYPQKTAGIPLRFQFRRAPYPRRDHTLEFTWDHRPELGVTEIYVPAALYPGHLPPTVEGPGAVCWRDESRQLLICRAQGPGVVRVRLKAE